MPRRGKSGNAKGGWQKLGALWESNKGNFTGNLQFLGIKSRIVLLEPDFDSENAPDFIIWAPNEIESPREEEGRSTRKQGTPRRKKKAPTRRKKKVEEEELDDEEEDADDDDDDDEEQIPF